MREYAEVFSAGGTSLVKIKQILIELLSESLKEVMDELQYKQGDV